MWNHPRRALSYRTNTDQCMRIGTVSRFLPALMNTVPFYSLLKKCLHIRILCAIIYFASGKPEDRDVAQMVERYIRDVEAARSNRVIPMIKTHADAWVFLMQSRREESAALRGGPADRAGRKQSLFLPDLHSADGEAFSVLYCEGREAFSKAADLG